MLSVLLKTCAVGFFLYGGYLVFESQFTEQLGYSVIENDGSGIELRQYQPFIVAEIEVQASNSREAASNGFRPLAGYIFGGNTPREKIKMTAPVTTQSSGEKISMTAPVTTAQNPENNTYTVQFSMPSEWTMDTLPQPDNASVRLIEKPAQLRIAKTYRGDPAAEEIENAKRELLNHANKAGYTVVGQPIWAGYSSPMVPKPLRKWEVIVQITRE